MAIHIGYPDLTQAQRVALCEFIDDVKDQIENLLLFEANYKKRREQAAIRETRRRLGNLRDNAEYQFPEGRADEKFVSPSDRKTLPQLRGELKPIYRFLGDELGISWKTVCAVLTSGELP